MDRFRFYVHTSAGKLKEQTCSPFHPSSAMQMRFGRYKSDCAGHITFVAFMNENTNECSMYSLRKPMANPPFLFALPDFLHPQMLSLHPLQLRHRWWWPLKCHCQRMLLSKYNSTYRPAPSPPLPFNHPWRLSSAFFPPNPSHRDLLIHPYIIPILGA